MTPQFWNSITQPSESILDFQRANRKDWKVFSIPRKPFEGLIVYEIIFCGKFFLVHLTASGHRRVNLHIPGRHVYGGKW